ncbi:MAG: CapA family protein [Burkholderiaceae bacterium]|nr:CapA family protein [Burkholderiaceae bacterium]
MKWALALLLGLACSVGQADVPSFSLVFAGDTTLDDAAGALIARGGDPLAHVASLFANADLRVANLECVVATTGEAGDKNYTFRAHPQVLPVLRRHLDGVTLANNHSGDYGRAAFAEMLGLLKAANLAQTGGGHNLSEAHTPWLVERAGLRVALLSYNEFMPRSFEADYDAPGIAWSEDEQVLADIQRARQQHRADLVLVFMHWGWENELTANGRQRQLARWLIDAGADAIIGGHPHVTQDIELYQGKPIIYSVGNFVMKETDNERQRQAWVLRMTFDGAGASGFTTHPVRLDADGIPHPDRDQPSPCWQRGQRQPGLCEPTVGHPASLQ